MSEIEIGRAADILIVENVMGWKRHEERRKPRHKPIQQQGTEPFDDWDAEGPHPYLEDPDGCRHYLCSCVDQVSIPQYTIWYGAGLAVAYRVAERIRAEQPRRMEVFTLDYFGRGSWGARFYPDGGPVRAIAPTPSLAICRAALKAKEV